MMMTIPAPDPAVRRGRHYEAPVTAAILALFSAAAGLAGIGALIAVLIVTPIFWRRHRAWIPILLAALIGGMVGAYFQGTEAMPPEGSQATKVMHMLAIVIMPAFFTGALGAGSAGCVTAAWLRRRADRGVRPWIMRKTGPLFTIAVIYIVATLVALPGFTNVRVKAARRAMEGELRNLAAREEEYFKVNHTFTASFEAVGLTPSPGVEMVMDSATTRAFSAHVGTRWSTTTCAIDVIVVDEAVSPGWDPVCVEHRRWF